MRLVPDSLAGRMSWVLLLGFVVTAVLTFVASEWGNTSRVLSRLAATVAILNGLPAEHRPAVVASIRAPGQTYTWPARPPPRLRQDFMSHHLARDIGAALANPKIRTIEAGYDEAATANSFMPPQWVQMWIELEDHSQLHMAVEAKQVGALWTARMVVALAVLAMGLVLLAMWAARRVAAPLRRFAAAAQRLGTDVNAPPMSEAGPREIRTAAQTFNQMQARIRRFVEERTLMLAAISHDLKTSLTRLKLRAESIPDEAQRDKIIVEVEQMDAMLNATLSFARDEAAVEPSIRLDLAVLLQSLCDDASDTGKTASYGGPTHCTYSGHPIALRRLFSNLIDNAIKYGDEAKVQLQVGSDSVEVTVEDRGPGIPVPLRERVFAPFFRVEASRNRETGGTGLGLTVARTLTHHHGGEIVLEDAAPAGLRVRITLPILSNDADLV